MKIGEIYESEDVGEKIGQRKSGRALLCKTCRHENYVKTWLTRDGLEGKNAISWPHPCGINKFLAHKCINYPGFSL